VLGPEHPDTLSSMHGLACLVHNRKQFDDAAHLYWRACKGYEKVLGPDHPISAACAKHYATMLREQKALHST
jgi:Tetratricopeptide repeat